MRTILEIFYLRVVRDRVRYQRKVADLSRKGSDPDRSIQALTRQKKQNATGEEQEQEFIVHSTSWRYEQPGRILLTYVAYSDELEFGKGKFKSLPLRNLGKITKNSRKPRSKAALEKKVVAHAMRHLAFLVQTDEQGEFKKSLAPETVDVFKSLWGNLAGKVF